MNPKNVALSPAATDLGLGQMLQNQVEAQALELKKKKQASQPQAPLSAASTALFGSNPLGTL